MAQRSDQDGTNTKPATAGEIDPRIAIRIVAQDNFTGPDAIRRDTRIGLQPDPEVGSGAPGAGAADDFVARPQGNGSPGRAGQRLRALGDHVNGRLQIKLVRINLHGSTKSGRTIAAAGMMPARRQRSKRRRYAFP